MDQLRGRAAFITGGARGIGLGMARAFLGEGMKVALADVDGAALDAARRELGAGPDVETFVLDVRDRAAFAGVADEVEAALGPVSVVCNNAGVAAGVPVAKLTYDDWDWALGVNLGGVVNGVQTWLPRLIERGEGHIVNTASGAGLAMRDAGPGPLYGTAKFAVVGLSESLRCSLETFGIGVSVLCPGPIATGIYDNTAATFPDHAMPDERRARVTAWLREGTSPHEVGRMVVDAVRDNHLYIHTDRYMEDAIVARTTALLAAMPAP